MDGFCDERKNDIFRYKIFIIYMEIMFLLTVVFHQTSSLSSEVLKDENPTSLIGPNFVKNPIKNIVMYHHWHMHHSLKTLGLISQILSHTPL